MTNYKNNNLGTILKNGFKFFSKTAGLAILSVGVANAAPNPDLIRTNPNNTVDNVILNNNGEISFSHLPEIDRYHKGNEAERLEYILNLKGNGNLNFSVNGNKYHYIVNNGKINDDKFKKDVLKYRNHKSETLVFNYKPITGLKSVGIDNSINSKKNKELNDTKSKISQITNRINTEKLKNFIYSLALRNGSIANYPSIYNSKTKVLNDSTGFDQEKNWEALKFSKWGETDGISKETLVFEILLSDLDYKQGFKISGEILSKAAASNLKAGTNIDLIKTTNLEHIIADKSCRSKKICDTLTKKEVYVAAFNEGVVNAVADYVIKEAKKDNYNLNDLSKLVSRDGFDKSLDWLGYIVPLNTVSNNLTVGTGYRVSNGIANKIKTNNFNFDNVNQGVSIMINNGYNFTFNELNSKKTKYNKIIKAAKNSSNTFTGGNKK